MELTKTKIENETKYAVKGVKNHRGHEGEPLAQCSVYCNGKRVALYSDGDHGGEARLDWLDNDKPRVKVETTNYKGEPWVMNCTPQEAALYAHVKGKIWFVSDVGDNKETMHTPESYISELISIVEEEKYWKKICKNKTAVKFASHGNNQFVTFKGTYSTDQRAGLEAWAAKNGEEIVEIYNERFIK